MRRVYILLVLIAGLLFSGNVCAQDENQDKKGAEINSADSTEYELLVFDAKFDTFLTTVSYQKNLHSNDYYRNWNIQYCAEWNARHQNPARYGSFYETYIHYGQSVDYGIDLNFKLYQYFQFIEKEYNIVLIHRKGN